MFPFPKEHRARPRLSLWLLCRNYHSSEQKCRGDGPLPFLVDYQKCSMSVGGEECATCGKSSGRRVWWNFRKCKKVIWHSSGTDKTIIFLFKVQDLQKPQWCCELCRQNLWAAKQNPKIKMVFLWKCGSGRAAAKESLQKHQTDLFETWSQEGEGALSAQLLAGRRLGIMSRGSASLNAQ